VSDLDGPIAAILNATPMSDGKVYLGPGRTPIGRVLNRDGVMETMTASEWGDPTPIAARQAAAAARALAEQLVVDYGLRNRQAVWAIRWLRARADRIEAGAGGQQPEGGE